MLGSNKHVPVKNVQSRLALTTNLMWHSAGNDAIATNFTPQLMNSFEKSPKLFGELSAQISVQITIQICVHISVFIERRGQHEMYAVQSVFLQLGLPKSVTLIERIA